MWSRVHLRRDDGERTTLGHGDIIGRLWSARLVVDDPRVSEAHALVSLRGHELKLLALRGRFAVDGRPTHEISLRPGQRITLADGLELHVEAVEIPASVLGLTAAGMPPRAIPGTCALVVRPLPSLAPPGHPDAVGHVWRVADGWHIRALDGTPEVLREGQEVLIGGVAWCAVSVALKPEGHITLVDPVLTRPLRLTTHYATAHIERAGLPTVVLQGLSARLLSELVAFDGPVPWTVLTQELWPDGGSRKQLDMALVRLRQRLRTHRVRTDLVHASGTGMFELLLHAGDVVEDRA